MIFLMLYCIGQIKRYYGMTIKMRTKKKLSNIKSGLSNLKVELLV